MSQILEEVDPTPMITSRDISAFVSETEQKMHSDSSEDAAYNGLDHILAAMIQWTISIFNLQGICADAANVQAQYVKTYSDQETQTLDADASLINGDTGGDAKSHDQLIIHTNKYQTDQTAANGPIQTFSSNAEAENTLVGNISNAVTQFFNQMQSMIGMWSNLAGLLR